MAILEHVNLVCGSMSGTLEFLRTAFPDWRVRGQGTSDWFGKTRRWLHFGDDDYYITLNEANRESNRDLKGHSPGLAHVGFRVTDLDELIQRLRDKGYEIEIVGADHPFRKNVYFVDPSGFEFEFVQYLSDASEERNQYGGETSEITRLV